MRKLTDAQVQRVRELAAEGWTYRDLAGEFGITPQHVGRLVRAEQRPQIAGLDARTVRSSAVAAVHRYLDGRSLDDAGAVRAEIARALAEKLDACRASTSAAAAHASPAVARQLVDVLSDLEADNHAPDALDELLARRDARRLAVLAGAA